MKIWAHGLAYLTYKLVQSWIELKFATLHVQLKWHDSEKYDDPYIRGWPQWISLTCQIDNSRKNYPLCFILIKIIIQQKNKINLWLKFYNKLYQHNN